MYVIIRSLRKTLKEAGIEEILEIKGGYLRVKPELVVCDLYRFLENDPSAVNAYRGEYMEEYFWANLNTEYLISQEKSKSSSEKNKENNGDPLTLQIYQQ